MRFMIGLALVASLVACGGGSDSEAMAGLDPDMTLTRSDGSQVTVEDQVDHLRALIEDSGYSFICGTLLTEPEEPEEPEPPQTEEDVEALHKLHVATCKAEAGE